MNRIKMKKKLMRNQSPSKLIRLSNKYFKNKMSNRMI